MSPTSSHSLSSTSVISSSQPMQQSTVSNASQTTLIRSTGRGGRGNIRDFKSSQVSTGDDDSEDPSVKKDTLNAPSGREARTTATKGDIVGIRSSGRGGTGNILRVRNVVTSGASQEDRHALDLKEKEVLEAYQLRRKQNSINPRAYGRGGLGNLKALKTSDRIHKGKKKMEDRIAVKNIRKLNSVNSLASRYSVSWSEGAESIEMAFSEEGGRPRASYDSMQPPSLTRSLSIQKSIETRSVVSLLLEDGSLSSPVEEYEYVDIVDPEGDSEAIMVASTSFLPDNANGVSSTSINMPNIIEDYIQEEGEVIEDEEELPAVSTPQTQTQLEPHPMLGLEPNRVNDSDAPRNLTSTINTAKAAAAGAHRQPSLIKRFRVSKKSSWSERKKPQKAKSKPADEPVIVANSKEEETGTTFIVSGFGSSYRSLLSSSSNDLEVKCYEDPEENESLRIAISQLRLLTCQ